jgi:hypothetical protein
MEAVLPRMAQARREGKGVMGEILPALGDVLSLLPRAVSAGSTELGAVSGGAGWEGAANQGIEELAQTKGKNTLENIAKSPSTYLPIGRLGEGIVAIPKLGPALARLPSLVKMPLSGATQAAVGSAADQGNVTPEAVGMGLGLGALAPIAGKGLGALARAAGADVGNFLKKQAARNVNIELRPAQRMTNAGYYAENALKHGLVGKPRDIAEQSQVVLSDLNRQAKEIGKSSTETVNIPTLIAKARGEFSRESNVHDYDKIQTFIDDLDANYRKAYPSADIPLADAMELRTQIGDKAAWVGARDRGGMVSDPDADWKEEIFNRLYNDIKDEIHAKGGAELQAINRKQSEIIPVRQTALRRMPIAESNNRVGLPDLLTGRLGQAAAGGIVGAGAGASAPGDRFKNALEGAAAGAGLALVRRGIGSKGFTKGLYSLGNKLSPTLERPLKSLNKLDFPSGRPWPIKDEGYGGDFEGMGGMVPKKNVTDFNDGDIIGRINENTANEINKYGFSTKASDVSINSGTIDHIIDSGHTKNLNEKDMAILSETINSPDEILPNILKENDPNRAKRVLLVKHTDDHHVSIVEINPDDQINPLKTYWKQTDTKRANRYLKQFREEKARLLQSGGRQNPHIPSSISGGGKPESLSGSQTEQTSLTNSITNIGPNVNRKGSSVIKKKSTIANMMGK